MHRVEMTSSSSLLILVFGALLASVAAGEVKILKDRLTWHEARDACRERFSLGSCDLITKERLDSEWSNLGISASGGYWVGAQYLYHWLWHHDTEPSLPLVQHHGCYKVTMDNRPVDTGRGNEPYQCYLACQQEGFLYLQADKCYCTGRKEGEKVPEDKCQLTCDSSPNKCGGKEDYFSVYSIPEEIIFEDEDTSENCAVGDIRISKLTIQSASCSSSLQSFCISDLQESQIDKRIDRYETAVSQCSNRYSSVMPTLTAYNNSGQLLTQLQTLTSKITSRPSFWLPLKRQVKAVWVDGTEGEEGGYVDYCIAATSRTASYGLSDLPCSGGNQAICYCSSITDSKKDSEESSGVSLKVVAIGIVVGVLLVVAIVVIFFLLQRRRRMLALEKRMLEERYNPEFRL